MAYRIALPTVGGPRNMNIVDGSSTAVQRALRRGGIAEYEPTTVATLLTLFDTAPKGFAFWDIGANIGLYAALCSALFEPNSVLAFEPTPSTAEIAAQIAKQNGFMTQVLPVAVGETKGTAPLYLSATSDASNSMVKGFKRSIGHVDVEVSAIDELVEGGHFPPDIIKLDVETFEPAVLRGARFTIEQIRPTIIVEVLNRRGTDHGPAVEAEVDGFGYFYYRLGREPSWEVHEHIRGEAGSVHRDWLLSPVKLDDKFVARYQCWASAVAICTADTNGRLPVAATARAVIRIHGWGAARPILRAARRRLRG